MRVSAFWSAAAARPRARIVLRHKAREWRIGRQPSLPSVISIETIIADERDLLLRMHALTVVGDGRRFVTSARPSWPKVSCSADRRTVLLANSAQAQFGLWSSGSPGAVRLAQRKTPTGAGHAGPRTAYPRLDATRRGTGELGGRPPRPIANHQSNVRCAARCRRRLSAGLPASQRCRSKIAARRTASPQSSFPTDVQCPNRPNPR